jgi:imidazolonepropionase
MLAAGLPVALATDRNPGSSAAESMPLVIALACLLLRMRPAEALAAATVNAAHALGLGADRGRLEAGLLADLAVWDVPDWRELAYPTGTRRALHVVKRGRVVVENGERRASEGMSKGGSGEGARGDNPRPSFS